MLKKILLGIAALIVVFLIVAAFQPNEFSYTRTATINAAPSAVFAQVNDFHKWEAWSPWVKMDPEAKMTYSGPNSGVGASTAWDGNNQIGQGVMTITESVPSERIVMSLQFIRPFKGLNDTVFTFTPQDGQTVMSWTMSGKNNYMAKVIGLAMNCEKMVGEQFDEGMANIKAIVEKP